MNDSDIAVHGLVGRDTILALMEQCYKRPRRGGQPLPIVVLSGAGGAGKTAVLTQVARRYHELPIVHVDIDVEHTAPNTLELLDRIAGKLKLLTVPQFGALRLPRYDFARRVDAVRRQVRVAQRPEPADPRQAVRLIAKDPATAASGVDGELAEASPLIGLATFLAKLLAKVLGPWLLVRRTPARPLLWGRLAPALRWYEEQRDALGLAGQPRIDVVAQTMWQWWSGERPGRLHSALSLEEFLIDALLADLRAAYRGRWFGRRNRYRTVNTILLLDDADLLTRGRDNLVTRLADRLVHQPDVPLLVLVAQQHAPGWLAAEPPEDDERRSEIAPAHGGGPAGASPDDTAARIYAQWVEELRREQGTGRPHHDTAFLHFSLPRLSVAEIERFMALRASDRISAPGTVAAEQVHHVTRGHPLAVALVLDVLHRLGQRWPRESPPLRSLLDEPAGTNLPGARGGDTVADYLRMRLLHRVRENTVTWAELARLAAARRLDAATIAMALGIDERRASQLLQELSTYSFVERLAGSSAITFHPLLRDLLTELLVDGGDYVTLHRGLRRHFHRLASQGDSLAAAECAYHALALGDPAPTIQHLELLLRLDTNDDHGGGQWVEVLRGLAEAPNVRVPRFGVPVRPRHISGDDRARHRLLSSAVLESWRLWSSTGEARFSRGRIEDLADVFGALAERDVHGAEAEAERYRRLTRQERPRSPEDVVRSHPDYARPDRPLPYPAVWPSRRARKATAMAVCVVVLLGYSSVHVAYSLAHCHPEPPWAIWTGGHPTGWHDPMRLRKRPGGECVGVTRRAASFVHGDVRTSRDDRRVDRLVDLIYAENSRVLATTRETGKPYVTIIAAGIYSSVEQVPQRDITAGVNELRGVYLAQRSWNPFDDRGRRRDFMLRVLLANVGGNSKYADDIAGRIAQLAREDDTVVAVTGLGQTRRSTVAAVDSLGRTHIPMVASVISGDIFTGRDYFFRVNPTNSRQVEVGIEWAAGRFAGYRPYVVFDKKDRYSLELKELFADALNNLADQGVMGTPESHVYDSSATNVNSRLGRAAEMICADSRRSGEPPALVVFTGRANELSVLMNAMDDEDCADETMVLGADDLAQLETGLFSELPEFASGHLFYTTFGPGRRCWEQLFAGEIPEAAQEFYDAYAQAHRAYDSSGQPVFGRPPNGHVMLAYDAIGTVTHAVGLMSEVPAGRLTREQMYKALTRVTGENAYPGAAGRVDFRASSVEESRAGADASDKLVVINRAVRDQNGWQAVCVASSGVRTSGGRP